MITIRTLLFRKVFPHKMYGNPKFFSAKPHLFAIFCASRSVLLVME